MTYLDDLFYSTNIYGLLGPLGLVILGYFIAKKDKVFGVFYYIILVVLATHYFTIDFVAHAWHCFILLFGGAAVCLLPAVDGGR